MQYCRVEFSHFRDEPYHGYKEFVIPGALEHGLPNDHVEWLRTFESQADPDTKRSTENEAVLFDRN